MQEARKRTGQQETGDRRPATGNARGDLDFRGGCRVTSRAMFQELLKDVVDNTEGGLATLLMDFEGIAVDSYSRPGAPFDITTIGAEYSVVLKAIQRAAHMLEAGDTAEVAIQAEKVTTLIRVV